MFLMIINKSVPEISIPLLTGGAAALFASICLAPMHITTFFSKIKRPSGA